MIIKKTILSSVIQRPLGTKGDTRMSTAVYNMLGFALSLTLFVVLSLNAAKIRMIMEAVRDLIATALLMVTCVATAKLIMLVIKLTY